MSAYICAICDNLFDSDHYPPEAHGDSLACPACADANREINEREDETEWPGGHPHKRMEDC